MTDSQVLLVAYGRLVRLERERRGLALDAVVERSGLSERQVRMIEDGSLESLFLDLARLAHKGLGASFSELIDRAEQAGAPWDHS